MSNFEVVDVPNDAPTGFYNPIIDALKANVGRAIKVSTEEKTANAYRQSIRAIMLRRGENKLFALGTKELPDTKEMLLWLSPKE